MLVLGIDPGIARCGWGIVSHKSSRLKYIACGVIETLPKTPGETRVTAIADEIERLIKQHAPDEVAMEKVFFFKNHKTVISTAQTQGAVMLTLNRKGFAVHEYTPLQVKQALTMYGRATKQQMQDVVMRILNLDAAPSPDDAADGLAIAITHAHTNKKL